MGQLLQQLMQKQKEEKIKKSEITICPINLILKFIIGTPIKYQKLEKAF